MDAPTWNPDAYDPAQCDHDALPHQYSHCIVCGWRWWLSYEEEDLNLNRPWTRSEKQEVIDGTAWPGKFREVPSRP